MHGITVPAGNDSLYFSYGNSKISSRVLCFAQDPAGSCSMNCSYCYARKIVARYPTVRARWEQNARVVNELLIGDPEELFLSFDDAIIRSRRTMFRWHVAGDFQPGLWSMAKELAHRHQRVLFYGYTKCMLDMAGTPQNLKILYSLADVKESHEDLQHLGDCARGLGYAGVSVILRKGVRGTCPHQSDRSIKCGSGCMKCLTGQDVAITLH
jgi:hypothetical protein